MIGSNGTISFFPRYTTQDTSSYSNRSYLTSVPIQNPYGELFQQSFKVHVSCRGIIYDGEIQNGIPNGKGVVKYENGNIYEGSFQHGALHGKGILKYKSGDIYEGEFHNNEINGIGILKYKSGDIYEGEFHNNEINGIGILKYSDGGIYTGSFNNNVRHGIGTIIFPNGDMQTGMFKDGVLNGKGTLISLDRSRYDGDFYKGVFHGRGTLKVQDILTYCGQFKDGKFHGQGKLIRKDGFSCEGEFQNGLLSGKGKLKDANGDNYIGNFFQNKYHGKGILLLSNKEKYEGEFENDIFCGQGIHTLENGIQYIGTFKDQKLQGDGIIKFPNGNQYIGKFDHGQRFGSGTYIFENGDKAEGFFISDNFVTLTYPDGTRMNSTITSNGDMIHLKIFLNNEEELSPEHRSYIASLVPNKDPKSNACFSDFNILDFLKDKSFDPASLSLRQVEEFFSYVKALEWFSNAKPPVQDGIQRFINRIIESSPISNVLTQEAWWLFGQFIYFMNSQLIKDSNKENALKQFDEIFFICTDSIPERIKGILSVLIHETPFSDFFVSRRNLLLEQYITDFVEFCSKQKIPELPASMQIHVRPWLANTLSRELKFHTFHVSTTDRHATSQQDSTFLQSEDLDEIKAKLISFFSYKIEQDSVHPTVEDTSAYMTALLHPLKDKRNLTPQDFEKINENIFDVLSPVLSGKVEEFDNRLELYFNRDDENNYSLNEKIFVDIKYLVAKYLEFLNYYTI